MRFACIYARYSTDQQQTTSIDDQVRRCKQLAAREGLTVIDGWVYSDEAITGRAEGKDKRLSYLRMLAAWDDGLLDFVFTDEVSRLTRDLFEGASLIQRVERTGVIVVSGDGIDTRREGWQTLWAMRLAMSGDELRAIGSRTARTMEGLLERGLMIASPPYGYALNPERLSADGSLMKGALWVIDPVEAAVVRDIYSWRRSGLSIARIALRLNDQGIPCPRTNGAKRPGYWRPGSVHRMLGNAIYKGVFVYQGSATTRAKLARQRKTPKLVQYPRPQFRIVDDAVWAACNDSRKSRRVRGGARHLLAGMLQCVDCGSYLSVGGNKVSRSLHCAQCEQAVRVGERPAFLGYTSVAAARQALEHAMRSLLTGPVREEFAARLKARLTAPAGDEEQRLKARRLELQTACDRLMQLACNPKIGMELIAPQLEETKANREQVDGQLAAITSRKDRLSKAEVERQLAVDPSVALTQLLDGEAPVHEVRALLRRMIDVFRFVARPAKGEAIFEIAFVPGALVASLADGPVLDDKPVVYQVRTQTSARRPVRWEVEVMRQR